MSLLLLHVELNQLYESSHRIELLHIALVQFVDQHEQALFVIENNNYLICFWVIFNEFRERCVVVYQLLYHNILCNLLKLPILNTKEHHIIRELEQFPIYIQIYLFIRHTQKSSPRLFNINLSL